MFIRESRRCMYCGRFLYNADLELPFEIDSTGAVVMRLELDINCGHCHRSQLCVITPASKPIRVDG